MGNQALQNHGGNKMTRAKTVRKRGQTWRTNEEDGGKTGTVMMFMTLGICFEVDGQSANVTESRHAQCELCRVLKTVRMKEQSANDEGNHQLLLEMLSYRECLARLWLLSHFTQLLTIEKIQRQRSGGPLRSFTSE